MTDKIKLKADKFVNDKKLKLNYIKPKDLKLLLAEFCEEQIAELKAECDLAIEGRDVKIKELETRCNELFFQVNEKTERIAELEKENAELKDDNKVMADNYSKMEQKFYDNLTKAKEIIKKFSEFVNNEVEYDPEHPQEHTDLWNELCEEAEQFIKDSEVEK